MIRVMDPGLLATVQDTGRFGWEDYGVARGGALDPVALAWANRLAENPVWAAGVEFTWTGGRLQIERDLLLAVTGAVSVALDGAELPPWSGFWAPAGSEVVVGPPAGARAYLAVHGGIAVPRVLGSRSTDLAGAFGGLEGRRLRAGDVLPVGAAPAPGLVPGRVRSLCRPLPPPPAVVTLAAVPGPRDDLLAPETVAAFWGRSFRVSPAADRMGIRLEGRLPGPAPGGGLLSEGMAVGAVQVPPDGSPIVLLAARGTMGGYPVVATVSTGDLPVLGQLRPGQVVRFRAVDAAAARRRSLARQAAVEAVPVREWRRQPDGGRAWLPVPAPWDGVFRRARRVPARVAAGTGLGWMDSLGSSREVTAPVAGELAWLAPEGWRAQAGDTLALLRPLGGWREGEVGSHERTRCD
ncbi:putative 5-oxoprolinase subunit C [Candidatus Hydrogenisulfobacillus filiaventi]|uniref:Putative 5-oxoprolinase subunit C n=1 Tax=Candidatus Hydrogenisulfobacillus filiaventi TaxID=2707344 RepID=A0A6F8ZGS9_9FIRM|nr:putative 5-oxoprolinase subunit C [Candidatus Hydrogenisulfobacillus filiaventi]